MIEFKTRICIDNSQLAKIAFPCKSDTKNVYKHFSFIPFGDCNRIKYAEVLIKWIITLAFATRTFTINVCNMIWNAE